MNKCHKLNTAIVILCFDLVLSAPELVDAGVVENLYEAVRTGDVCIEHEDHVDGVSVYLLCVWVPEHSRVIRLALLNCDRCHAQENETKNEGFYSHQIKL